MSFKHILPSYLLLLLFIIPQAAICKQIKISDNHRYLQWEDGQPFFYLGDTAWELFHRLNREEATIYLSDRAKKGFTVIQAVAIAELNGINVPNANGYLPFENQDPLQPNEKYWQHIDFIVNKANQLGLVIGMLPTWGCYWHDKNLIYNPDNALKYGKWLAQRYKNAEIIWILGGDRNPENDFQKTIIRNMAKGLEEGDSHRHLKTYHPTGWCGSAQFFHNEDWLDFNMRQNGHENNYVPYAKTLEDYHRQPTKPILDGEPLYEDHPIAFKANERGHSVAADCRRALYWDLFNGACGHTYGHHSVWQMYDKKKNTPINHPLMDWKEAIERPGASQMIYGKNLILSRPIENRIPAPDDIFYRDNLPTSALPGSGTYRFVATMDEAGSYLMVYVPIGRMFTLNTSFIKSDKLKIWWFNPRNGKAKCLGTVKNDNRLTLQSPTPGELLDWILVIDDATKGYKAPGKAIY